MASSSQKVPITRLPRPNSAWTLTHSLTPDPMAQSASKFVALLKTNPSWIRKSRAADASSHFAYVTPLPVAFPYRIAPPPSDTPNDQRMLYIEKVLSSYEPLTELVDPSLSLDGLKSYQSTERDVEKAELLSLAPTCLRDCLPHLDVGDALDVIAVNAAPTDGMSGDASVREKLVDILSGRTAMMRVPASDKEERGYAPWSLRYSGHQFGSWAGQLGDGRAVSILEATLPDDPSLTFELQLKGAGRTPFSRGGDGLAVLRSSVREYLVAEAMHALRIPTTRSLSLISLPPMSVAREEMETAAIVCRVAQSFIRIGNFQALNSAMPDMTSFLMGGGGSFAQQPPHYEGLRVLGEWVSHRVLRLDGVPGEPWGKKLLWECARRNAIMVAGWQTMGFMHGVMNTDNISIAGLTIDYGPYAFMDVFNRGHICNHTDETGRYSYKLQPTMIVYALQMLLKSLAPIIGFEMEHGKAIPPGWADGVQATQMTLWSDNAIDALEKDLDSYIMSEFTEEYQKLMRQRLGLKTRQQTDRAEIFEALLDVMENLKLDFHRTFRHLTRFRARWMEPQDTGSQPEPMEAFLRDLLPEDVDASASKSASEVWLKFLAAYGARISLEEEQVAWIAVAPPEKWEDHREENMKAHNPRFVLRQWVLEELISTLQKDAQDVNAGRRAIGSASPGRAALNKILLMCTRPFEAWGAEATEPMSEDAKEQRRLCETGPKKLLGFQCSCSS